MKYLLLFFYFSQFCAVPNTPIGPPPYFYIQSFNTYAEAKKEQNELEASKNGKGVILYGFPEFITGEIDQKGDGNAIHN